MAREEQTTGELAALAASLRQNVEHAARSKPAGPGAVEARFLRRLAGALNAYETAHQILATPRAGDATTAALRRQACPACGGLEFEAVGGGWVVHLLCRRCGTCSRAGQKGLVLTDASGCPTCDAADVCPNRNPGP